MGMETGFFTVQYCVVVSLGTVIFMGCTHCTGQLDIGPRNISRMDGEYDVFIPCPFSGQYLPIWKINGTVYEPFQIVEDVQLQGLGQFIPASRGLLIPSITHSLSGFSFRCLYPTRVEFSYLESSLGILTVTPRKYDFTQAPPMPTATVSRIYIDHQNTLFQKDEKQVGFKMSENANSCNHTDIYLRPRCDHDSPIIKQYPITNTSVIIDSEDLIQNGTSLAYFSISSEDGQDNICGKLLYDFRVNQTAVTEPFKLSHTRGGQIKIPVEDQHSVFIVLPQPKSSSGDCSCVIILNDQACTDLIRTHKCNCIENTIFSHSLTLCKTTQGLTMDIENVTDVMHGARIFFYNGHSCGDPLSNLYYRTYIASYEIFIVLPEPPKWVNVSSDMDEICTSILNENNTITMVDNYDITVYDVTGETKFHESFNLSNSTDNCTYVGKIFKQDECAPYLVNVSVHNDFGSTYTNVTVLGNSTQMDTNETSEKVCACLKDNVHITATNGQISGELSAEVYCLKSTYAKPVHLKAIVDADNVKNFSCFTADASTPVSGQICGQPFNLSIHWSAPNEIALGDECELLDNPVTIACHGISRKVKIIIGVIVAAVGTLSLASINLIICCRILYIRRRNASVDFTTADGYESINK